MTRIDLKGSWKFCLDREKLGIDRKYYNDFYEDIIFLPTTVSEAKKGISSDEVNEGYLTDPYHFEGFTWYTREITLADTKGKELFLILERTRISHVWIDGCYIGNNNSLCTTHRYRLTPFIHKVSHKLTIMVDNTSYPVKGGHMTSPDTQTNWNGIVGGIYIEVRNMTYLTGVKLYPDTANRTVGVKATLVGAGKCTVTAFLSEETRIFLQKDFVLNEGENCFTYEMEGNIIPWSEHNPKRYALHLILQSEIGIDTKNTEINLNRAAASDMIKEPDHYEFSIGFRDFIAEGKYFNINGKRTFLRGKHDGLIFPMTGYAPMDIDSWLRVMGTAKEYGINHYRFHTCCPPEAAFTAADMLGIYLEPELPFWGTVTEEGEENHDEAAQQYLIAEGFRILDEFGNHPSFVLMSLGNELWGSSKRLNEILGGYRRYDTRHLYTQGSNNFQFMPCNLENEDFFCGVRFSRDRLFRGSYAMCDAPQGHIQTLPPDTIHNYDELIRPTDISRETAEGGEVAIQYGTGTKTVKMDASEELIPKIPVVSHEIGQYAMYPDFKEIERYTGVLKPRNLQVFQKRLEDKGLLAMAEKFFTASGRFAVQCYKAELETALRSNELAGFQILDLQDFTGQGTALIGILNSFMESKGLVTPSEWRQSCSDLVILAELPRLVYRTGEVISIGMKLVNYSPTAVTDPKLRLTINDNDYVVGSEERVFSGDYRQGVYQLGEFILKLPELDYPKKFIVNITISGTEIQNSYDIWLYPEYLPEDIGNIAHTENSAELLGMAKAEKILKIQDTDQAQNIKNIADGVSIEDILITDNFVEVCYGLQSGRKVLYYPSNLNESNSIEGTYCTDFWCYPMFRSISESMEKPVPIGTHGLLIDEEHPIFRKFPTESYSTPQWYDFVSNSRAVILDDTNIEPVVWTIDNFERNHRLGNLFELKAGEGKLLVCTSDLRALKDSFPAKWLEYGILKYITSQHFKPKAEVSVAKLKKIFN